MKRDQFKQAMLKRGFTMHIDSETEPGEIDVYILDITAPAGWYRVLQVHDTNMYDFKDPDVARPLDVFIDTMFDTDIPIRTMTIPGQTQHTFLEDF